MRPPVSLLIALVLAGSLSAGGASAQQARTGAELLATAERSFSDFPFGAAESPVGLTRVVHGECQLWGECIYHDADRVGHYFWEGELVVKDIEIADVGDRPIGALAIGTARSLDDVLGRVRRFLPEAEVDCYESSAAAGVEYDCGAMLGEGWVRLFFDSSRRLRAVRIDARHFT